MKIYFKHSILALLLLFVSCMQTDNVEVFVTTGDQKKKLDKEYINISKSSDNRDNVITIDSGVQFQEMDGFGVAITGSSCYNLLKMSAKDRHAILKETFDSISGNGYSYIRISIGTSDFSLDEYTYCDTPGLENFAIHEYDVRDLFPILREILTINPAVKIMASPWTSPKWMKVNNLTELQPYDSWTGGQLNPQFYKDYAEYFVRYLKTMTLEGFNIDAITIQNEPLNAGNSASLIMSWQEQRDFIKTALGPAFEANSIDTKIIVFDHNYDYDSWKPEAKDQLRYPIRIYEDEEAARYIDGAAYHAYGGHVSEMDSIHNIRPDKNLYFTETSIGLWGDGYSFEGDLTWNMREVCLGSINRHCKAVIVWNYMLDSNHGPFRSGGCDICKGAIDIDTSDYKTLTRNSHFYSMAHLAKVVKSGAYRIQSTGNLNEGIHFSAFKNPDGSYALVLLNDTDQQEKIYVRIGEDEFTHLALPKSVNSYHWNNNKLNKQPS